MVREARPSTVDTFRVRRSAAYLIISSIAHLLANTDERVWLPHYEFSLSMTNAGPNTNGSQVRFLNVITFKHLTC